MKTSEVTEFDELTWSPLEQRYIVSATIVIKNMEEPQTKTKRYWTCIIGPLEDDRLPAGADYLPRMAARHAIQEMTGEDPVCSSGWCTEIEYQRIMDARYPKLNEK